MDTMKLMFHDFHHTKWMWVDFPRNDQRDLTGFDLATESRSIPSSHGPKRLRHGPLRERLLTAAGGKVTHAMDQEIHRLLTPPVVKARELPFDYDIL